MGVSRRDQRIHAIEVVVDEARRNAGLLRDRAHAGAGGAGAAQHARAGFDQALPPRVGFGAFEGRLFHLAHSTFCCTFVQQAVGGRIRKRAPAMSWETRRLNHG
jgi:hypothetical protein